MSSEEPAGPAAGSLGPAGTAVGSAAQRSGLRRAVRTPDAWLAGLRRGAGSFVLGVLCLLASLPAIEDLHALLRTLGAALIVLGAVILLATVYLRD